MTDCCEFERSVITTINEDVILRLVRESLHNTANTVRLSSAVMGIKHLLS